MEFYVCPVYSRLQLCLRKIKAKTFTDLESTSSQKPWVRWTRPVGSSSAGMSSSWSRIMSSSEIVFWTIFTFQPGTIVPLVGEAGDKETLPGHPRLPPHHCPRLPRLPQLQVSLVLFSIPRHFWQKAGFAKEQKFGKSEFREVRNSSDLRVAAFPAWSVSQ